MYWFVHIIAITIAFTLPGGSKKIKQIDQKQKAEHQQQNGREPIIEKKIERGESDLGKKIN